MYITPLTPTHFNAWQPLWQDYLNFYHTELPTATTTNTWQNLTQTDPTLAGFGAFDDTDTLLGFVHVVLHPNTWNTTNCCYLEDLFVTPKARGQGIATALINQIYAFAKQHNCHRVYWVTDAKNTNAQRLYDTLAQKTDFIQYRHNLNSC